MSPQSAIEDLIENCRARNVQSNVYFAQPIGGGLIKIGFATNLRSRMARLQAMSPIPLGLLGSMTGDVSFERVLHVLFDAHRAHGEWFAPHRDILEFIAKYTRQDDAGSIPVERSVARGAQGVRMLEQARALREEMRRVRTEARRELQATVRDFQKQIGQLEREIVGLEAARERAWAERPADLDVCGLCKEQPVLPNSQYCSECAACAECQDAVDEMGVLICEDCWNEVHCRARDCIVCMKPTTATSGDHWSICLSCARSQGVARPSWS